MLDGSAVMKTIMNVVEDFHDEIDYERYKNCNDKYPGAHNCVTCCSNPYYRPVSIDGIPIDYRCSQKRKLYIVRYAPAYISEVYDALVYTSRAFRTEILQKETLNVASIGGGPGTDIAAFNKWLLSNCSHLGGGGSLKGVRYLGVDIHEEWGDVSVELVNLHKLNSINYEFKQVKINVSDTPIIMEEFKSFDVIILSYVISEIHEGKIKNLAKHVFEVMSEKTLIIINDRAEEGVLKKIDLFLNGIGCVNPKKINPTKREHCGEIYPDDIKNRAGVTLFKKSVRYNAVVEK